MELQETRVGQLPWLITYTSKIGTFTSGEKSPTLRQYLVFSNVFFLFSDHTTTITITQKSKLYKTIADLKAHGNL